LYLVLDVGNTNIKSGLYEGRKLLGSWRIYTINDKTSDEYGIEMVSVFRYIGQRIEDLNGIIISSVRPSLNYTMEHMCEIYFGIKPVFVSHNIDSGLKICYDKPELLGADRIVNAVAAYDIYGGPCITVDFGTATTFGAISRNAEFTGGVICPGIRVSTDALIRNAANLPTIEFLKPETVIQKDTISAMQSGIIYGYAGLVDHIVSKMRQEMGETDVKVIATGGLSQIIAAESGTISILDSLLTLEGLSILYLKQFKDD
jgi:type III pantothenate kinase